MLDEFFSVHYSYGFLIIIMFLLYAGKRGFILFNKNIAAKYEFCGILMNQTLG